MACSSTSLSSLPFSLPRARFLQSPVLSFLPSHCNSVPSISRSNFSSHFPTHTGFRFLNASSRLRVSCMCDFSKAAVITKDSWEKSVLNSKTPVLVEFYASWCGPCRMVDRVIDEIAGEYAGRIKCFLLNADNDPKVAAEYDVKAVPVVMLFKNGEKCASVIGTMPKEFYVAAIERVLNS